MSIEFNPNIHFLDQNNYLYSSDNKIYLDQDTGVVARIKRAIFSLLSLRNYQLDSLVRTMKERNVCQKVIDHFEIKLAQKCGITPKTLSLIKHFSTANFVTQDAKERAYTLLREVQGNNKLNAAITAFSEVCDTIPEETVRDLLTYSHKSGKFSKSPELHGRVSHLNDTLYSIHRPEEKLTLKELRSVDSLAKMTKLFAKFQRMGVEADFDPTYRQMQNSAQLCQVFADRVKKEATKELKDEVGLSLFCYDFTRSKPLITLNWIQTLLGPVLLPLLTLQNNYHLSVAFEGNDEKMQELHMWDNGGFSHGEMPIISYAFKRLTFSFDSVITNADAIKFHALYGDGYKNVLREKLVNICRKHQEEKRYTHLKNGEFSRFFSFLVPKINLFTSGWREKAFFSDEKNVTCVQFAITQPLIALRELEAEIELECAHQNKFQSAPPKFSVPVHKAANLNRIMPHNVVQAALYEDGITVEDAAPTMHNIVQIPESTFTYFPSLHKLQGFIYNKFLAILSMF